ncbi:MAG: hypothetical protein GXO79_06325 [Chlorobi bacterium]|nr:hypothetical protein [Chlorobiota bacterium]
MQAYQFINYNNETTIEHIKKYAENNAILCFDFEDSIKHSEKQKYREYFKHIINNILPILPSTRICLRINNEIDETVKDLKTLSNCFIDSIILPKIESVEEIRKFEKLLAENNISYNEIIPTIESKTGLSNLELIVKTPNPKIKRYGFGHCDYNLSINSFPFFHQNSIEYWKWIKHLYSVLKPRELSILNSPYLELDNYSFYKSMLHYLYSIFGDDVAQTTLTIKQTKILNQVNKENDYIPFEKLIKHRLDLKVSIKDAEQIISSFEKNRNQKAFSILEKDKVLISPQEYIAAKNYVTQKRRKTFYLTFVGGCFPVQNDILFEDLFHQRLKRKIECAYNIEFNINIIRYERFNSCLKKIINYKKTAQIDFLIFHVRPEPFLRAVKFLYKHLDKKGKIRYSLNIPSLKIWNTEKFNILKFEKSIVFKPDNNQTKFHKALVNFNYKLGEIFGNLKYSLNKYFELTSDIVEFCNKNEIFPIVLGMGNRNNSSYEPFLCKKSDEFFKVGLREQNVSYVELLNIKSENINEYFRDNGIYASEKYHELIAEKLFSVLEKKLKLT